MGKGFSHAVGVGGRTLGRGNLPLLKSEATREGSTPSSGILSFIEEGVEESEVSPM